MKLFFGILLFSISISSSFGQCTGNEPTINLGNDTILCFGQTIGLSVPAGYDFYQWSNGSTSTGINVTQPGTHWVLGGNIGTNQLILNGDFEGGTTAASNNFTTAYVPGTGGVWGLLSNPGQYAISTSPSNVHNNFASCGDHTTGTGNMLIVNGATAANTNVWSQTAPVVPNQNYIFSFWAMNVADPNVAQLQLRINNVPISAVVPTSITPCIWNQITGVWNSGSATSANLSIFNQATAAGGNDFAIDDIFFADNCVNRDTIQVTMEVVTAYAGADKIFCPGDTDTVFATTNNPNNTLTWNSSGVPGNFMIPDTAGIYTVTAVSPAGCTFSDDILISLKDMNWTIADIVAYPSGCGLTNGVALTNIDTLDPNQPDPLPFNYQWSGPGAVGPTIATTPNIANLSPGWYYLTTTSDGCSLSDSVEIITTNGPVAAMNATSTNGYAPLDVTFQNQSQSSTSYTWIFDTLSTQTTINTDSIDLTFNTPGVYQIMLIASNGNCADTSYLTITVLPPPIIPIPPIDSLLTVGPIPNVISPNADLINDYFTFTVTGAESFSIEILNRWGNLMYSSTDPDTFGWSDTQVPDGVYFYKMTATGYQGEQRKAHGFFHIVR